MECYLPCKELSHCKIRLIVFVFLFSNLEKLVSFGILPIRLLYQFSLPIRSHVSLKWEFIQTRGIWEIWDWKIEIITWIFRYLWLWAKNSPFTSVFCLSYIHSFIRSFIQSFIRVWVLSQHLVYSILLTSNVALVSCFLFRCRLFWSRPFLSIQWNSIGHIPPTLGMAVRIETRSLRRMDRFGGVASWICSSSDRQSVILSCIVR